MGAPQLPKPIEDDEYLAHVAVVEPLQTLEENKEDGKMDRKNIAARRRAENDMNGERRRQRRPNKRKRWVWTLHTLLLAIRYLCLETVLSE